MVIDRGENSGRLPTMVNWEKGEKGSYPSTIVSPTPRPHGGGDLYIRDCRKSIAKILHQLDDQDDGKSLLEMTLNIPDVFGGEKFSHAM